MVYYDVFELLGINYSSIAFGFASKVIYTYIYIINICIRFVSTLRKKKKKIRIIVVIIIKSYANGLTHRNNGETTT